MYEAEITDACTQDLEDRGSKDDDRADEDKEIEDKKSELDCDRAQTTKSQSQDIVPCS